MKLEKSEFISLSWMGVGLLLLSASSLSFEINLTRLFSVSQFYHFAFMVVSIALLGLGASGTFLALRKVKSTQSEKNWFPFLAVAAGASMLISYLFVNKLPFDSFSIILDPRQIGILLLHYAVLASPFFFVGMLVSMMLRTYASDSGKVYALNLIGSATGCMVALLAPSWVGGEGMVALSAVMAAVAGVLMMINNRSRLRTNKKSHVVLLLLITAVILSSGFVLGFRLHTGQVPAFFQLAYSPYKSIAYALKYPDAQVISTQWNSFSKVDVVRSQSLHSVPGLSYRYLEPLPSMNGLFIDGDNLNAIPLSGSALEFAEFLPVSLAYDLHPKADVLILEPKGGMDILAALSLGAEQITAVESNPLVIDAASSIYHQKGVQLVQASGRSYLHGGQEQFDIIHLPLTESYHPVSSGAYSLGENYTYTVEALGDMIARLKPNGLLVMTRWLQEEPSEWLRAFTLAVTALEDSGGDPSSQIVALRGYNTGTLFIKNCPFTSGEMMIVRQFASEKAFDLVSAPTLEYTEINRYNILPNPVYYQTFKNFLETQPREDFYKAYPFDVEPPTDNHPFFSHYFKWSQLEEVVQSLGVTWQPFGGAGYLVVLIILALALVLSGLLILLPPLLIKGKGIHSNRPTLPLYFGLIGLAFMLVEMPLIQHFILFLDQPAYALTAVLFCILLFSGLGSRYGSQRVSRNVAFALLIIILVLELFLLPHLLHALLGLSLLARSAVTLLLIAPIGFLMGIPFPSGLAWIESSPIKASHLNTQWMTAWVWAVNGASSVVASILASLLSLSFGFRLTLGIGIVCYALAWIAIKKLDKAENNQE